MPLLPPIPDRLSPVGFETPPQSSVVKPADVLSLRMVRFWLQWLRGLVSAVNAAAQQIGNVVALAQTAAIALTAINTPTLNRGLYRVTYLLKVTEAAAVSSSAAITFRWVDDAIAQSWAGAAVAGNTLTSYLTETFMVAIDEYTQLEYEVAYASVGAPAMKYKLYVIFEAINVT